MRVRVRPMTDAEYDAFADESRRGYAAQIAAGGDVPVRVARAKADRDFASILPEGRDTDGHLFLQALDDNGAVVGHLWLALHGPGGASASAWVYDIEVAPERRGHGYGRAIMEEAEREAYARGVGRIGLNVFGFNTPAIQLYRSLGYQVSSMQMTKRLGTAGADGPDDEPGG